MTRRSPLGLVNPASRITTRGSPNRVSTGDDGQLAILVIGFVVIALALVSVVASATSVHLERVRLAALADLAALDAADTVADAAYYAPGGAGGPGAAALPDALSDEAVAAAVASYLAENPDPAARWDDVRVLEAGAPDGRTARVRLGAVVRPALVSWVLAPFTDGIEVEAASSARAW